MVKWAGRRGLAYPCHLCNCKVRHNEAYYRKTIRKTSVVIHRLCLAIGPSELNHEQKSKMA